MKHLQTGQHFGENKQTLYLDDCVLSEAGYVPDMLVPWHYHENAYFYYHLKGHLVEVNKKKSFICRPGTILFHHWQDPHYNTRFSTDARFLHVELEKPWFQKHGLSIERLGGSTQLTNISLKSLFIKMYRECMINDELTCCSIDGLLLQTFSEMLRRYPQTEPSTPHWVKKIKDILREHKGEKITLQYLSSEINVHPVHLSREFPRYFQMTFGEYYRKIKLERSVQLLGCMKFSLTDIAYDCGYADQSHFIRSFKAAFGITPSKYRQSIFK